MVVIKAHGSIPLVVSVDTGMGAVDGDLVVVGTNAMAMSVRVREQTTLLVCVHEGAYTRYREVWELVHTCMCVLISTCLCKCVCVAHEHYIKCESWNTIFK